MLEEYAVQVLNPETEIHYAMRSSFVGTKFPHRHDFYEFFLLMDGWQEYETGGKVHTLSPGALVLVRPGEAHSRRYLCKGRHINVAFSAEVGDALLCYLGNGFPKADILNLKNLPYALLNTVEKEKMITSLQEIGATNLEEPQKANTKLRVVLFNLFVNYFSRYVPTRHLHKQDWFDRLLEEMQSKNNFTAGVPRMVQLCGKSSEHLCRVFKQKKNLTPTEYVNELRLNYAASLLTHSDESILNISLSSGFESLSHFYHLFSRKFSQPPGDYRHTNAFPPLPDGQG